jgi:flavin-dependent dehydrogenase
MDDYDAIIIGTGQSGPSLARRLVAAGQKVAVIERASQMSASVFHPSSGRPDCMAEVVGFELRNVVANYPFERSHRFARIKPTSGHRDHSRLSCGARDTSSGPKSSRCRSKSRKKQPQRLTTGC